MAVLSPCLAPSEVPIAHLRLVFRLVLIVARLAGGLRAIDIASASFRGAALADGGPVGQSGGGVRRHVVEQLGKLRSIAIRSSGSHVGLNPALGRTGRLALVPAHKGFRT